MVITSLSSFGRFFADYGEYHNNTVNKIVHIICIPFLSILSICYKT